MYPCEPLWGSHAYPRSWTEVCGWILLMLKALRVRLWILRTMNFAVQWVLSLKTSHLQEAQLSVEIPKSWGQLSPPGNVGDTFCDTYPTGTRWVPSASPASAARCSARTGSLLSGRDSGHQQEPWNCSHSFRSHGQHSITNLSSKQVW